MSVQSAVQRKTAPEIRARKGGEPAAEHVYAMKKG
jgi:hypothetical protein